jgi:uncharacterized protein
LADAPRRSTSRSGGQRARGQQSAQRSNRLASRRSAGAWPWLLGLALLAALAGIGALVWSRSGSGQAALLSLGAEKLHGEVQARLELALAQVLPQLTVAAADDDAHDWPLPPGGVAADPGAVIRCRVVGVGDEPSWWQLQLALGAALQPAGGKILWSERLPRSNHLRDTRQPHEARDVLRVDIGAAGRPTHTLLLYRERSARPEVRWGADPAAGAWRQLLTEAAGGVIALVIDDWGYRQDATTSGLLALDAPLTLSVLPGLPYSRRFALEATPLALPTAGIGAERGGLAEAAALRLTAGCPVTVGLGADPARLVARRREVILHLPMQPQGYPQVDPGPRTLLVGMPRDRIGALLDEALQALPNVRGVNNHMGSAATADLPTMQALMSELKARDLIFLDSLTSANSVAYQTARDAGLPAARNRIFLDHDHQDRDAVRQRLRRLVQSARSTGFAVGIGHPHPATLQVLREELPRLEAEGVRFVTLSELLALQTATGGG